MAGDRFARIEELYHAALELEPARREPFLVEACAGNEELLRELTLLVQYDDLAEDFMARPVLEAVARGLAEGISSPPREFDQTMTAIASDSAEAGKLAGHFRILRKIGQGGMGQVYLAHDTKLGRNVAIKRLAEASTATAGARQRFLREARAASALNHPNIVTIHAIEEADGVDFIVMECVEGEALSDHIARGPVEFSRVLDLGCQVAAALDAAHQLGIVHRDVKPGNILVSRNGVAKVLDFGVAKRLQPISGAAEGADLSLDLTGGRVIGTIAYMSPEQTRGEALDARSDIFSLGVVLYEAATGRLPFHGVSALSLMHEIASSHPPPPSSLIKRLPAEFDFIIERALAKERDHRYSSAAELSDALNRVRQTCSGEKPAFEVADQSDERTPALLVGREVEMRRLGELLSQAVAGSGRLVFITGEPGIGKTSLSDEFLRWAARQQPSLLVSRGRCVQQYGTGEAYLPFLDALSSMLNGAGRERVASVLRTHAPTWCLQFPAAFPSSGVVEELKRETIGATKARMIRELSDAFGALASTSPVLLLLEDLHWADPSSVDLLLYLCHRISAQRLLVIGTFRPEDLEVFNHPLKNYWLEMQGHKLCDEIALGSLTQANLSAYLEARFSPNTLPLELSVLLERKTEGHPLFAVSLVEFLAERGDIAPTDAGWSLTRPLAEMDLEAPENVRSMIRKKIEALSEDDRRALQYASIEGEEFLSVVIADLLGVDDLIFEESLERLARVNRLVESIGEEELPDGTLATRFRFRHSLFQNLLYGGMINKRRVMLHRRAGDRLKHLYGEHSVRIATQLAMHFELGRDYGRAIEYLIHAGDNAVKLFASEAAASHYSRALSLVEKLPQDRQAATLLAIYRLRGAVDMDMSRFAEAVEDYTQMLARARETSDAAQESMALIGLTNALYFSHRLEEMTPRVAEALAAVERCGSEPLRLEMLGVVGAKHICYGELNEAKPLLDEIIRCATEIDHKPALLHGLVWRGQLYFFNTEYDQAESTLTRSRDLAEELRNGRHMHSSLFFLGLLRANQGRMSEALATLNQAIEMAARNGDRFSSSRLPNCIGFIHHELQDFEGALRYNRQGIEVARRDHALEAESNSLINIGRLHLETGKKAETMPAFHDVEEIFKRDAWFRWRYNIRLQSGKAEYWLARGDLDQSQIYARKLLEIAQVYDGGKYIAIAHKLAAEIAIARGDLRDAEAEFKLALDVLRRRPVPVVEWKVYAALGRLRVRLNDVEASRIAFARANEIVDMIAGHVDDDGLRALFLNSAAVREVRAGAQVV